MILGDRDHLAFELEPVEPSWQRSSEADCGPWARLKVWARGRNLTKAQEESTDRVVHDVAVPLTPIAEWLFKSIRAIKFEECPATARFGEVPHDVLERWNDAEPPAGTPSDDWEDRRYEWYQRHFWLAGCPGSMLPDLGLVRADGKLVLSWRQPVFPGPRRLQFIEAPGVERIPWERAWPALSGLVEHVVAADKGDAGGAEPRWIRIGYSLDAAAHCTSTQFLEYAAPFDQSLAEALRLSPQEDPEQRPSLLALRDLEISPATRDDVIRAATLLDRDPGARGAAQRLADLRTGIAMALNAAQPEAAGRDAARWLRSERGLDGQPFSTAALRDLVTELASLENVPASSVNNSAAVGFGPGLAASVVLFRHARTEAEWAMRMELARSLAHLLLDPTSAGGALGAASSRVACGPRRRRSGAFAAELLLPSSSLAALAQSGRSPGDPGEFKQLMQDFGVGATTGAYHLWNQGFLGSEEERDWLVDEYGRQP